jgi:preprotein translocase subunit SecE
MVDNLKLAAVLLIIVGGIGGFYYLSDQPEIVRWLVMLGALGAAAAVGYTTATGRAFAGFAKDARGELRKVVWPTNRETMQATLIVFALVVVIAIFLWVVDWGLAKAVRAVMRQGA